MTHASNPRYQLVNEAPFVISNVTRLYLRSKEDFPLEAG